MTQTCSREASIRQSLLDNFKDSTPLEFPKKPNKSNGYYKFFLFTPHYLVMCMRAMPKKIENYSIYNMSNDDRDKLSNLTLKRIEELSKKLNEYDGSYIEI